MNMSLLKKTVAWICIGIAMILLVLAVIVGVAAVVGLLVLIGMSLIGDPKLALTMVLCVSPLIGTYLFICFILPWACRVLHESELNDKP